MHSCTSSDRAGAGDLAENIKNKHYKNWENIIKVYIFKTFKTQDWDLYIANYY